MGIFEFFQGKPGKFISEEKYQDNLDKQLAMSPQTLDQLRKHGVKENSQLKLEFFFYTNSSEKALALFENLNQMGYSVEQGPSASDKKTLLVTGWTTKLEMSEKSVLAWTKLMCEIGYRHDCDFDGWGTNPKEVRPVPGNTSIRQLVSTLLQQLGPKAVQISYLGNGTDAIGWTLTAAPRFRFSVSTLAGQMPFGMFNLEISIRDDSLENGEILFLRDVSLSEACELVVRYQNGEEVTSWDGRK